MNLFKRKEYWLAVPGRAPHYFLAKTPAIAQAKAAALAGKLNLSAGAWTIGHDPEASYHGRFQLWDVDRGKMRDVWRDLETPRRDEAGRLLKQLAAAGARGRFDLVDATKKRAASTSTHADLFARYRLGARVSKATKDANITALLTIHRRAKGKTREELPLEKINALPLSELTQSLMVDMQNNTIADAGTDQLARQSATVTANCLRRCARSLFSRDSLPLYAGLHLPDLAPFLGVRRLKEPAQRFRVPPGNLVDRIRAAVPDLRSSDPNCYRIWLLALGSGLRKNEIMHATWDWLDSAPGDDGRAVHICHVQTTAEFRPKGRRDRVVPVEPFAHAELTTLRVQRLDGQPGHILDGTPYQRRAAFIRFGAWLKTFGWDRRKKAHELRKMFGSEVAKKAGLAAAQELLGHEQITTTAGYYVDGRALPQLNILGGAS